MKKKPDSLELSQGKAVNAKDIIRPREPKTPKPKNQKTKQVSK